MEIGEGRADNIVVFVLWEGKEILFPGDCVSFLSSLYFVYFSFISQELRVLSQPSGCPKSPIATVTHQDLLYPHNSQILIYFLKIIFLTFGIRKAILSYLFFYKEIVALLLINFLWLGFFPFPFSHFSFLAVKNFSKGWLFSFSLSYLENHSPHVVWIQLSILEYVHHIPASMAESFVYF